MPTAMGLEQDGNLSQPFHPKITDFGSMIIIFWLFRPVERERERERFESPRPASLRISGAPRMQGLPWRLASRPGQLFFLFLKSSLSVRTPSPQTPDHQSGNGVGGCPEGHAVFASFYKEFNFRTPSMDINGSESPRGLIESPIGGEKLTFKPKTVFGQVNSHKNQIH